MTTPAQNLGMAITLEGDMTTVEEKVTVALKEQGFGILTEIDVQATFKKKLDVDYRPYKILGACNPGFAHQALNITEDVGLLLPCNVTLTEKEAGKIDVSFIDPLPMLGVIDNPELANIANQVRDRLQKAVTTLSA